MDMRITLGLSGRSVELASTGLPHAAKIAPVPNEVR